ncbi:uncharacterized protein UV8b_07782 [Ustilaginoidea virens]|uniref:Uncharacterized protein n=1 Tax=Ustilaginoidea virens TaxID=1159556 RepID=A0A063BSI9_USTVR|nr:uncharacterized protein UV8b_07782 [Ustilaginoidea virens]QUC23541.1 hypothetical protein UV8b_07782 [Ustilaginoidea virens]GAO15894.1 hypothetical protein UVI_02051260 [Ustilaginoidea virens]
MKFSVGTVLALAISAATPIAAQINDDGDFNLEARDAGFEEAIPYLEARQAEPDFEEIDLEARDIDQDLEARDVELELEARDVEPELEARDVEPELEARGLTSGICYDSFCPNLYKYYITGVRGYKKCKGLCNTIIGLKNQDEITYCLRLCDLRKPGNLRKACQTLCFRTFPSQIKLE